MRITQLELHNIKSYGASTVIPFSGGVNAISGPNGAGKSTILEAIGFALFDELPYTQSQFLREGEKRGEIIVSFVDAMDDREYQVVRPIGSGTPYVYDPHIRRRIVTGKRDTTDWLHEHLGLDPTAELKALFRDAVGVPQGALTAPFLESRAAVRKATFDPLLQVDDYETAWQRLRDTVSYVRDLQQERETQMAELSGQLRRRVGLQQEEEELQASIADDRATLTETTSRFADLQQENTRLEGLRAQIDDLAARQDGISGRLGQLQRRQADALVGVEDARKALSVVQASTAGYRTFETAQSELAELEGRRRDRDGLATHLNTTNRDIALLVQRITDAEETLARVKQAEARAAVLVPLIEQQDRLEIDLQSAKRDVDRWHEAKQRLDEERERLHHLQAELARLTKDLETRSRLEADVKALEVQRERAEAALEKLRGRLSDLETERAQASTELQTAERSEWELQQANDGLAEVTTLVGRLQDELRVVQSGLQQRHKTEAALAESDRERRVLGETLSELDRNQAAQDTKIQAIEERIGMLGQAEGAVCPVCQQSLPEHKARNLVISYEASRQDLERQREAFSEERTELTRRLAEHDREASALRVRLDDLPHATREAQLIAQIEEQQNRATELQDRVTTLGDAVERALELRKRLEKLSEQFETVQREREEQEGARSGIDRKITAGRVQSAELPSPRQQELSQAEIKAQEEIINAQEKRLEGLAGAQDLVADLSAKLAALGNPRQEGLVLEVEVKKREAVEGQLDRDRKARVSSENEKHTIEAALSVYADLDNAIADQQALLQQHAADHQAFLRNQQAAQSLPEREGRLAELGAERAELEEERSGVARELTAVRADYDPVHHQAVGEQLGRVQREEASITERLHLREARLASVKTDLRALKQLQDELDQATADRDALAGLESTLRFLRDTIRQAGPFVTRRLVQSISLEADRIFGDVIADHAMRLSWGDDYSISVESRGEKRVFQQLSGGEQMAAALAVRLALLREMSDVDIAFFDEPTANLDDERRENLAEQITGIKGFSQLFVISHDDTFEQETQHVVHIRKEHGVSRVEVR